jgi:4-hydroxy-tetrahydrodipicolinate synthase
MPRTDFSGTIVDLVTPFRSGELDQAGLSLLLEWQIQCGIEGLLVCGEAGESHCLSMEERQTVIATAVEVARGRVPVLVGVVANCTDKAIDLVGQARAARADGVVLTLPYYNRPAREGVLRHVTAVSLRAGLPLLVLSRPAASMMPIDAAFVAQLRGLPNLCGIVDCGPDPFHAIGEYGDDGAGFGLFYGDEQAGFASCVGAAGFVSWVANVSPRLATSLHHAAAGGNPKAARLLHSRLTPLLDAMKRDHPVSTLKQALAYVFGIDAQVRLPLLPVESQNLSELRQALSLVGLSTDLSFLSAVAIASGGGLRCRL